MITRIAHAHQIRDFLDGDAANYENVQVLVASDGLPRIELFHGSKLVDTIHVFRYTVDELNNLLERDLGQTRNRQRTWQSIRAEMHLHSAIFEATGGAEKHQEEIQMIRQAMEKQAMDDEL